MLLKYPDGYKHEMFKEIFRTERHQDHKITTDESGKLCWESNELVKQDIISNIGFSKFCALMSKIGFDKNSEVVRKALRETGISLEEYYDFFYLDNPIAKEYSASKEVKFGLIEDVEVVRSKNHLDVFLDLKNVSVDILTLRQGKKIKLLIEQK